MKRLNLLRFPLVRALALFGAGTAASTALAIQIAVLPLKVSPADPVGYMLAHPWPGLAIGMVAEALIGFFLYRRFVRKHEHREPTELAISGSAMKEFAAGLAVGAGFITAVMGILWLLGVYYPTGFSWNIGLLLGLTLGLGGAFLEEPTFRGLLQRFIDKKWGAAPAIIVTAIVFGLIHVINTIGTGEASLAGPMAVIIEALPFIAAYYLTRRLWLAIGIHLAWNTTLYGIFGMPTSGVASLGGVIGGSLKGAKALTGGSFGPEGSVVMIFMAALLSLVLFILARRKGKFTLYPREDQIQL